MKKRRILCLLLALTAMFFVFGGCKEEEKPDGTENDGGITVPDEGGNPDEDENPDEDGRPDDNELPEMGGDLE